MARAMIGPAIAGILVANIGEGWCFFANAVSYIAVIAGLLMMRMRAPKNRAIGVAAGTHHRRISLRPRHRGRSARFCLLLGLVSVVAMPYSVLMPVFADEDPARQRAHATAY